MLMFWVISFAYPILPSLSGKPGFAAHKARKRKIRQETQVEALAELVKQRFIQPSQTTEGNPPSNCCPILGVPFLSLESETGTGVLANSSRELANFKREFAEFKRELAEFKRKLAVALTNFTQKSQEFMYNSKVNNRTHNLSLGAPYNNHVRSGQDLYT